MSDTPKDQVNEVNQGPRITYIGNPVNTEVNQGPTKKKNPNRVAAGKRMAALRRDKKRVLKEEIPKETEESECESSAINVAYIACIFGIVTGAIAVCKWLFSGECNIIEYFKQTPEPVTEPVHNPDPEPRIAFIN